MEKSTEIFTIIKYQKNVFNVFARLEKTNKNDNCYQKHKKKSCEKKFMKDIKRFQKKKKTKGKKKAQERYQNFTEEENRRVDRNISEGKKKETS